VSIERDEVLTFLKRDPLVNANLIGQLLHTQPLRVNLVRDDRKAVTGVILIEPLIEGEQADVLVHLDSRGPEEVPELLRYLRAADRIRLELHRPWMQEQFAKSPHWRATNEVIQTFGLHPSTQIPPSDPNVIQLNARHATAVASEPLSWAPSTLRRYLKEGRRAFAYQANGRLVARAVSGLPTPHTEEITAVYTAPESRHRGLGRAVVIALANDIRAWGRVPTYVTTADNEASQRLVRSLDFKQIATSHVFERLSPEGL
jgi:ribosomal protein S18 acetylase RimI-like enzyme